MQIDHIKLENPFILAPLAGYTDLPFRILCREYGASLCVSEMISCHGLSYRQEKTLRMLISHPDERPVSMQLFGANPDIMGEAAAIISEYDADIIDINMGCPVKKVTKRGAGSALMKEPQLASQIIRKVCSNTDLPVTVKIRSGWTHQSINAPEFAKMAEDAGAKAITVHGRTWSDGFSGRSDWSIIKKVKQNVSIPVIGNGDILCHEDGLKMMEETGCDAVMIGRAALGAPWIFRPTDTITMQERLNALQRHLDLINQFFTPDKFIAKVKSHACRYFKGAHGSALIRKQIFDTKTFDDLYKLVCNDIEQPLNSEIL